MLNRREFVSGLAGAGIVLATGNLANSKNVPLNDFKPFSSSDIEAIRKRYIATKPNSILHCFEHIEVKPGDIIKTSYYDGVEFPLGIQCDMVNRKRSVAIARLLPTQAYVRLGFRPVYEHVIVPLYGDNVPTKEREWDALDLIKAAGDRLVSKVEFPITNPPDGTYENLNKLIWQKRGQYSHMLCSDKHKKHPGSFFKTKITIIGLPEIDENTIYLTTKSELIYLTEHNRIGFACLDENSIETIHFSK